MNGLTSDWTEEENFPLAVEFLIGLFGSLNLKMSFLITQVILKTINKIIFSNTYNNTSQKLINNRCLKKISSINSRNQVIRHLMNRLIRQPITNETL